MLAAHSDTRARNSSERRAGTWSNRCRGSSASSKGAGAGPCDSNRWGSRPADDTEARGALCDNNRRGTCRHNNPTAATNPTDKRGQARGLASRVASSPARKTSALLHAAWGSWLIGPANAFGESARLIGRRINRRTIRRTICRAIRWTVSRAVRWRQRHSRCSSDGWRRRHG
jgi:hypothetical protein